MDEHRSPLSTVDVYRRHASIFAAVPFAWIALFFVAPLATMIAKAFSWSAFLDVLGEHSTRHVLWFTVWQASASVLVTLVCAWPVTWACSRFTFRGRRLVRGIVSAPFVLPTVVVAAAMRSVLPSPWASGTTAILLAHALFNIAVVVRVVGARWERESPALVETARTLGMSPLRAFATITWPHLRSSVMAAAGIIFVFCFTSFGVIRILGGSRFTTLEVDIYIRAAQLGNLQDAVALSVVQLVVVLLVVTLLSRRVDVPVPNAIIHAVPIGDFPNKRRIVSFTCVGTAAIVLLPFMSMLFRSFRTRDGWTTHGWSRLIDGSLKSVGVDVVRAATNSIAYMTVTVLVAVPLAICAASVIAYSRRPTILTRILLLATSAPIATSAVALGLGIVITFDVTPVAWRGEWWMLPCTYSVIALPLMVRTLVSPLRAVPNGWRDVSATLGASPLRTWWNVDIRSSRRPILLATGLCAAVALGEFGATSFLTRSGHDTLPVAIARLLSRPGDLMQSSGYALAFVMVCVVITVMSRA